MLLLTQKCGKEGKMDYLMSLDFDIASTLQQHLLY